MAMPSLARHYTVAEVLALPADGNRYELVHGELLVTPAPRLTHQIVVGRLYARLYNYLEATPGVATAFLSPADITVGNDVLVQPDVFVVPNAEVGTAWSEIKTLLLTAEVVSPTSARYDRVVKRRFYQQHGVPAYWVVDPDAAVVEVWRPEDARPEIVADVLRWQVSREAPELNIDLAALFAAPGR